MSIPTERDTAQAQTFSFTPKLLAVNPRLRAFEERQIILMADWSLEEKMNYYAFRPAPDVKLASMARNSKTYKNLNTPFRARGYVVTGMVGPIMEHRWLHAGMDYEQWKALYLTEVLPYPSLIQLALRVNGDLRGRENMKLMSRTFALNALCNRTYKQSNDGFTREHLALTMARVSDPTVRRARGDEDNKKHLDLVGANAAFQVKPNSFVCVATNDGLRKDQIENLYAQRIFELQEQSTGKDMTVFYLLHNDLDAGLYIPIPLEAIAARCGLSEFYTRIRLPAARTASFAA